MSAQAQPMPTADRRPQLALLLALLGIPGSTVAWSLPAGGFWIGVPLAIAAIVIGARSHGDAARTGRRLAVAAIVLAAIEILFMATWTVTG